MFLLQCNGRSGSTYLGSLLSSHEEITMWGEFLYPDPEAETWLFYHHWANAIREDRAALSPPGREKVVDTYVEKMKADSAGLPGLDTKLEYLDQEPWLVGPLYRAAARMVLLKRSNVLKHIVSRIVTYTRVQAGVEAHNAEVPEKIVIAPDPAAVIQEMRESVVLYQKYAEKVALYGKPSFTLLYEDLVSEESSKHLGELQEFLGVERKVLTSTLRKQNPQPLKAVVANYADLEKAIRRSEFEYTLYMPT